MVVKLWGITTTGSNNGEINNLNLDATWISLVTTAIADGSPTPVFCNSSYEHVYAYLYNGKDTDCFVACFNRAFGQVKKGYAEYRLRQDYLEFLTDSYWLSEREIFSVNTRLRSDNYCINRYLLNLIRSSLLDYVVGYIRKYGYQIKRIEVKLDGTFYFTVVW